MEAISDIYRRLHNLVCLGKITEVDHSSLRVRVDIAGRETGWLRIPAHIGRNYTASRPLRAETPVLLACPSGDPANAVIVEMLYNDALPPPSLDPALDMVAFDSGTTITHDATTGDLVIYGAGNITVQSAKTLCLEGKNIEIRSGEEGYHLTDNAGRATRLTHIDGPVYETDSWTTGTVLTGQPDHGFAPPRVDDESAGWS